MSFQRLVQATQQADSINITFRTAESPARGVELHFSRWSQHGFAGPIRFDGSVQHTRVYRGSVPRLFDDVAADLLGVPVRFESVAIKTRKSPESARDLTPIVIEALASRLEQPVPDDAAMKRLKKAWKADLKVEQEARDARAALQERREAKRAEFQRAARQPEKKVTDVPSFLEALQVRIGDPSRTQKAMKMLKKDGFELFNDVSDDQVVGVVKSQSDASLVYACRLQADGNFSCCTQNLNTCGGLRGRACKHLLVLLIGLVQQGELDPVTVDRWLDRHLDTKPSLDRDAMGDVFLKYKGAEAGELDWRPTETTPEDFYAY